MKINTLPTSILIIILDKKFQEEIFYCQTERAGANNSRKNTVDQNKIVLELPNYNQMDIISHKYTDSEESEDEGMEDYKIGGYHPVHVG